MMDGRGGEKSDIVADLGVETPGLGEFEGIRFITRDAEGNLTSDTGAVDTGGVAEKVSVAISDNPYIQAAFRHGEKWCQPAFTDKVKETGGYILDVVPDGFEQTIVDRRSAEYVHREVIDCGVTEHAVDSDTFSARNVLLEIVQNSESKDSKGSWFDVQFLAKGQWYSVVGNIEDFGDEEVEAVRIVDNGKGYMPQDMTTIGGGKRYDADAAGKFGSGMKLSDRIALGHGMEVKRWSRNWSAAPFLAKGVTSAGLVHTVSYDLGYCDEIFPGSVVEYRNPTADFICALRELEDIYLPLDRTFADRWLAQNRYGIVLEPKGDEQPGKIMVAGRSYELTVATDKPLAFSYDLHSCDIDDQNRHFVDTSKVTRNIRDIWEEVEDKDLWKRLFQAIDSEEGCHEASMRHFYYIPNAFKEAVREYYGLEDLSKAYIDDGNTSEPNLALLSKQGYVGIKVPESKFLKGILGYIGIKNGNSTINNVTSIHNLPFGLDAFDDVSFGSIACRAISTLKDACPDDQDVETVVLIEHSKSGESEEISLADYMAGKSKSGYAPVSLVVRAPGYMFPDSILKFGTYVAANVAAVTWTSVYNGNYELNPSFVGLGQIAMRNWSKSPASDLEIHLYIKNKNQAAELKKLNEYSLEMGDYQPFERTPEGDIISLDNQKLYEQGIRMKSRVDDPNFLFSYNFSSATGSLVSSIACIIASAKRYEVPLAIMRAAEKTDEYSRLVEFMPQISDPEIMENWRRAFEEVFGEKAVVNDLRFSDYRVSHDAVKTANLSGIKSVILPKTLMTNLVGCGVKTLSESLRPAKAMVYDPNPLQEEFMKVSQVVDAVIAEALPDGFDVISPNVVLVDSLENKYGQSLTNPIGYQDPTLYDSNAYVFESALSTSKIAGLIDFLLNAKIKVYDSRFRDFEDFWAFKTRAMVLAGAAMGNVQFFTKIQKMFFGKKARFGNLVEVLITEVKNTKVADDKTVKITEDIRETRSDAVNMAVDFAKFVDEVLKDGGRIAMIAARTGLKVTAALALVGGVLWGAKEASELALDSDFGKDVGAKLSKAFDNSQPGYQRPRLRRSSPIGVSIERRNIRRTENEAGENYAHDALANFITTPKLTWGYFMSEQSLSKYTGTGWESDPNAPSFKNPKYAHAKRFSHYQKTGGANKVELRTRAGGYIDTNSIKLIKKDGSIGLGFIVTNLPHGEVELSIFEKDVEAILYQTTSPINWQGTADGLTDADFGQLDQRAYAYYTQTPDLDLSKIKFQSTAFSQFENYQQFIDYVKTLSPIDRVTAIRSVVLKMRYTRTERTEAAFKKFHSGDLEQKDFLDFILSSDQLEYPGDGDCDTQNTIAALLFRYAGIPAKLDFVFNDKGVGHGPASIFLPKIGWILSDTMGDRTLIEKVQTEDPRLNAQGSERTAEEAEKKMIELLRRHAEYQARECYKFD